MNATFVASRDAKNEANLRFDTSIGAHMAKKRRSPKQPKPRHEVNKRWFVDQIARRGLSQRRLGPMMGLTQAMISQILSGNRFLQLEEAGQLAELLNVPFEDIVKNAGIKLPKQGLTKGARICKVVGIIGPRLIVNPDLNEFKTSPQLLTAHNPTRYDDVVALRIRTLGGPHGTKDGGIVYYRKQEPSFDQSSVGRYCVVKIKGQGNELIRDVCRGLEAGTYDLLYLNGQIAEGGVQVEYATPILHMAWPE